MTVILRLMVPTVVLSSDICDWTNEKLRILRNGRTLKAVLRSIDAGNRLFEMGFAEQLRAILGAMSDSRQTLLFSATLPAALAEFARAGLRDPELVRLDVESKLSPDLGLAFFTARFVRRSPWHTVVCAECV